MKTYKLALRFASVALIATVAASLAVACSGDDNNSNPAPTVDSGNGSDGTMQGDDSSTGSDSTSTDTSTASDAPSLDTGSCKSDAGTCNSCYTAAQAAADPYNACSQYTANCVKFDPARVPSHPTL
jgi:hypothetical protein